MAQLSELLNLTFKISGVTQLDRTLGLMMNRISDMTPIWKDIYRDFRAGNEDQFRTQGSASGGWRPLSPDYAAYKSKMWPGKTILMRSGDLYRSLTVRSAPNAIYRERKQGVTMGTSDPKAMYHAAGTRRMPARPPIELTEQQKSDWPKMIHEYLWRTGQFERVLL